jgi:hypothetical protein
MATKTHSKPTRAVGHVAAIVAVALVLPVGGASEAWATAGPAAYPVGVSSNDPTSTTVQYPTAAQIAAHEGRSSVDRRPQGSAEFPTARQLARHEGRLPESPSSTTSVVAPSSDGSGDTLAIVLLGGSLVAGLGAFSFVVARKRRSPDPLDGSLRDAPVSADPAPGSRH